MKKDFFLQFGARACPDRIPRSFSYSSGIFSAKIVTLLPASNKGLCEFWTSPVGSRCLRVSAQDRRTVTLPRDEDPSLYPLICAPALVLPLWHPAVYLFTRLLKTMPPWYFYCFKWTKQSVTLRQVDFVFHQWKLLCSRCSSGFFVASSPFRK